MNQSENINELGLALSKVQGELDLVFKDKKVAFDTQKNDKVKYKYADLASCYEACKIQLSKNQIAIIQAPGKIEGEWLLTTTLIHSSGQWVKGSLPLNTLASAQALGSQITYLRRYQLCSMVGIAPEDDDGKAATKEYESQQNCIEQKNIYISDQQILVLRGLFPLLNSENKSGFFLKIKQNFNANDETQIPLSEFDRCILNINARIQQQEKSK